MKITEAREKALWDFVNNNPDGHKRLAVLAISCAPFNILKIMVEDLGLEGEVSKLKKYKP